MERSDLRPRPSRRGRVASGTLAGGILVVVGGWLDWCRPSRPLGSAFGLNVYDIPAQFLVRERGFVDRGGPAIGVLVILLGLACYSRRSCARPR